MVILMTVVTEIGHNDNGHQTRNTNDVEQDTDNRLHKLLVDHYKNSLTSKTLSNLPYLR